MKKRSKRFRMAGVVSTGFEDTRDGELWDGSLKTSELGPVLNYSARSLSALSCGDPGFGLVPREHGRYHRDDVETFLHKRRRYPLLLKLYPQKRNSKHEWCRLVRGSYSPWRNRLPEGCGVVVFDSRSHDLLLIQSRRGQISISINLKEEWSKSVDTWNDNDGLPANAATREYLDSVVAFVICSLHRGIHIERLFFDDEAAVFANTDEDSAEDIRCSFDWQRGDT